MSFVPWSAAYEERPYILPASYYAPPLDRQTAWKPDAILNEHIRQSNGIQSNWAYRRFLQAHGHQLRELNHQACVYDMGYEPYYHHVAPAPAPSDLKLSYLSREQLQARLVAPYVDLSKPSSQS